MRGRNTGNRKGPNPLSRTYESNGPDVKIRGTAHHIGEKYLQLARDAQSSGDPVMAESFLQHAEHYFRLIAAAQAAQQTAAGYQRQPGEPEVEEFDDEEDFTGGAMDRFASPIERVVAPAQPAYPAQTNGQPTYPEPERTYSNGNTERPLYERPERGPRQERNFQDRNGQERNSRDRNSQDRNTQDRNTQDRNTQDRGYQDRGYQDRGYQDRNFQDRQDRPAGERQGGPNRENEPRNSRGGRGGRDYRLDNGAHDNGGRYERGEPRGVVEEVGGNKGLPAFITSPVRLQTEPHLSDDQPAVAEMLDQSEAENEATGFHLRPRRRRRGKADLGEGPEDMTSARDPVGD
jgi:hypothetical protein